MLIYLTKKLLMAFFLRMSRLDTVAEDANFWAGGSL